MSEIPLCVLDGVSELRIGLGVTEVRSDQLDFSNGIEMAFLQMSTNREVTVILGATYVLVVIEKTSSQENLAELSLDIEPSQLLADSLDVALVDGLPGSGGVGRIEISRGGRLMKTAEVLNLRMCSAGGSLVSVGQLREGTSIQVGERVLVGEFGVPLIVSNAARGLLALMACVYIYRLGQDAILKSKKSKA